MQRQGHRRKDNGGLGKINSGSTRLQDLAGALTKVVVAIKKGGGTTDWMSFINISWCG
jgi:hypothetical protein